MRRPRPESAAVRTTTAPGFMSDSRGDAMDQRWSTRTPVVMDVDLLFNGQEVACKTRNVSLGGVFLELSPTAPLDALVELTFKLGAGERRTKHKMKAKVVHAEADGMGLMFRDFDAASFRALQEVVRYTQSAQERAV